MLVVGGACLGGRDDEVPPAGGDVGSKAGAIGGRGQQDLSLCVEGIEGERVHIGTQRVVDVEEDTGRSVGVRGEVFLLPYQGHSLRRVHECVGQEAVDVGLVLDTHDGGDLYPGGGDVAGRGEPVDLQGCPLTVLGVDLGSLREQQIAAEVGQRRGVRLEGVLPPRQPAGRAAVTWWSSREIVASSMLPSSVKP